MGGEQEEDKVNLVIINAGILISVANTSESACDE